MKNIPATGDRLWCERLCNFKVNSDVEAVMKERYSKKDLRGRDQKSW